MFTGIIQAVSPVIRINSDGAKSIVTIALPNSFTDLKEGSSIACNGICLTVLSYDEHSFRVEVMNETKAKSNANLWKVNDMLNLEPALRLGDRLDGHWVQGHIDTTLPLIRRIIKGNTTYLYFSYSPTDSHLMVPQGSIAINGVSLTLAELYKDQFSVALIGHTLDNTNLNLLPTASKVNIEFDILGKYILRLHDDKKSKISMEWLHEQGF